ncbi:MAG: aspartate 1-decarboxylase [Acidobacteriota bacterium]
MLKQMLLAKIHRATVTRTDLDYEGSLSLDASLMREAGMVPYERVDIYDCDNGSRFSTYLIEAPPGSGQVCVNGAAARLAAPGHRIIIAAYAALSEAEVAVHQPKIVLVDTANRVKSIRDAVEAGTEVSRS